MIKTFLLDTNVLMYEPKSIFMFEDNEVIIPLVVLDELDKHKSGSSQISKHARMVIRYLDELRELGDLSKGVKMPNEGTLRVELNHRDSVPRDLDQSRADNRIISVALGIKKENAEKVVSVVTKDINLRVKCDALGVYAEDYISDSVVKSSDMLYAGVKDIVVEHEYINTMHREGILPLKIDDKLHSNEYVLLQSASDTKHSAMARYDKNTQLLVKVKPQKEVWGISSRNKEQAFAFDALLDTHIRLATIVGKAGSGKTILSIAAAIHQLLETRDYKRIVLSRPTEPLGRDIGYLPGPQPLDAKILTPDGWSKMGDLSVGNMVIGRNGKPTKVLGIYPKGKKMVYKINTTENTSTECCIDHLWLTQTAEDKKRKRRGKIKTTKQILDTIKDKKGKINHFLPRNEAVCFNQQDLPISPYILGCILGDGSISDSIVISNTDIDVITRISDELKDIGHSLTKDTNSINYNIKTENLYNNKPARPVKITNILTKESVEYASIGIALENMPDIKRPTLQSRCDRGSIVNNKKYEFLECPMRYSNVIKNYLYELGLMKTKAESKFIPDIYKYNSIENRIALLQGIMDADGTIKSNGEASFCTSSSILAKDIEELVRSLGGRAVSRKRKHRLNKGGTVSGRHIARKLDSFEFTVSLPSHINPFFMQRKSKYHKCKYMHYTGITSIEELGEKEVQCIRVEDEEHLYITDDFIVTHNSAEEKMHPWMMPFHDNLDHLLSRRSSKSMLDQFINNGDIEICPLSYIRGRSLNDCIMILDECQQLSKHEVKTVITRLGDNAKIIMIGDVEQIDTPYLDSGDNGLSYAVEKFKDFDLAAHITLSKGERSALATAASELL